MAKSLNEWELSKENIQPIQQGRKPSILKAALTPQIEDEIAQQRQHFEQELRTYSGEDPLSVWCRYIKWVEQNFPKGGKEGHIEKLIQQCLSVLRQESKYFDDKRFVDVWLKFANMSVKPLDVYNFMYSHSIGCKSSNFFIAWAWELEQLSNWKKADDVLTEGIRRNVESIDKIKSARSEFENRMATHVMNSGQKIDSVEKRSAFSLLNPQNKRNEVPVIRVGENITPATRESMTLGHRQPQPKNTSSAKVPFKIYNSENVVTSLPVQSERSTPFVLHNDATKENEKNPGKWNKAKLPKSYATPTHKVSSNPGFTFHCDEGSETVSTPRLGSKTSSGLSSRKNPKSPPLALFEPHDPMKRPMYDRNKIYGGAEEFSFEEIRAAKWFEEKKRLDKEREEAELKNKVKILEEQLQLLKYSVETSVVPTPLKSFNNDQNLMHDIELSNSKRKCQSSILSQKKQALSIQETDKQGLQSSDLATGDVQSVLPIAQTNSSGIRKGVTNMQLPNSERKCQYSNSAKQMENLTAQKIQGSNPRNLDQSSMLHKQVRHLPIQEGDIQNHMLSNSKQSLQLSDAVLTKQFKALNLQEKNNPDHQVLDPLKQCSNNGSSSKLTNKNLQPFENMTSMFENLDTLQLRCNSASYNEAANMVQEFYNATLTNPNNDLYHNDFSVMKDDNVFASIPASKQKNSFSHVQPVNNLPYDQQNQDDKNVNIEGPKTDIPFSFFHDPTDIISKLPKEREAGILQFSIKNDCPKMQNLENCENKFISNSCSTDKELRKENIENIPPPDYVQTTENRELAGILEPSKNIPFLPLEDQDLDDVSDEDEEDPVLGGHQGQVNLDENTLNYTKQFAVAPFIASTPCLKSKQISLTSDHEQLPGVETEYRLMPPPNQIHYPPIKKNEICSSSGRTESVPAKENEKLSLTEFKVKYGNSTVSPAVPGNRLSIIMESSAECYSKSSSSSSSNSACSTKLGSSHFSHQHSILHKQLSKADTLTEMHSSIENNTSKPFSIQNRSNSREQIASSSCETECQEIKPSTLPFDLYCINMNPFDSQFTLQLLDSLPDPINNHKNMHSSKSPIPNIRIGTNLNVGGLVYAVEKLIAEGSYAKVYAAKISIRKFSAFEFGLDYQDVALKVCKNGNLWEFYVCTELHNRLSRLNTFPIVKDSVMEITSAITYSNGIIIVNEYHDQGTLLDMLNMYKKRGLAVPEYISMYFTLEMLQIVSKIHKCKMVHADIKPDNFILTKKAFHDVNDILENLLKKTSSLCLIDFGRAIDLNFFKEGVCFNTVVTTDDFTCNEMKESKNWVYQPDWYGVLGCIHVLLFSEYMKVKKNSDGYWEPVLKFKRYWQIDLWQPLFNALMNIPSCYNEPDVTPFIDLIVTKLRNNSNSFITQVAQLENLFLN